MQSQSDAGSSPVPWRGGLQAINTLEPGAVPTRGKKRAPRDSLTYSSTDIWRAYLGFSTLHLVYSAIAHNIFVCFFV